MDSPAALVAEEIAVAVDDHLGTLQRGVHHLAARLAPMGGTRDGDAAGPARVRGREFEKGATGINQGNLEGSRAVPLWEGGLVALDILPPLSSLPRVGEPFPNLVEEGAERIQAARLFERGMPAIDGRKVVHAPPRTSLSEGGRVGGGEGGWAPRGIFAFLALLALIAFLALTAFLAFLAFLASVCVASLISALSKARGEGGELAGQVRTRGQGWAALQLSLQKRSPSASPTITLEHATRLCTALPHALHQWAICRMWPPQAPHGCALAN